MSNAADKAAFAVLPIRALNDLISRRVLVDLCADGLCQFRVVVECDAHF